MLSRHLPDSPVHELSRALLATAPVTQDKELARREKEFKQQMASASALLKDADAKSAELSKQAEQVRWRGLPEGGQCLWCAATAYANSQQAAIVCMRCPSVSATCLFLCLGDLTCELHC